MRMNKHLLAGMVFLGIMTTSCIDDKYDLSDIDTTVRVEVRDLVIPVNIDEVTLGSIITINPGDRVQVVDGVYAVTDSGKFSSEKIEVKAVHMAAPSIPSTSNTIEIAGGGVSFGTLGQDVLKVDFTTDPTSFSSSDESVTSSIVSVESVGTEFDLVMTLSLRGFENRLKSFKLTNFNMQLPKGLTLKPSAGEYKSDTGIFKATSLSGTGNSLSLKFSVSSVAATDGTLEFDGESHAMTFSGQMNITAATLEIAESDLVSGAATILPSEIVFGVDYTMSDINVTDFTGEFTFSLDVSNITDVDLSDLPDALSQEGTNLRLANPQIYLSLENPVAKYKTYATTGLEITANRNGQQGKTYGLDAPGYFEIPGNPDQTEYTFCLSPEVPKPMLEGYAGAKPVGYTELSNVLSGNGLPQSLSINLVSPQLPVQPVSKFKLGEDLGKVEGHYTFFAPLALDADSEIRYTDTEDGWSSEDLDKMTISVLAVSANVTSTLPLDVELSGYPVDKNGHKIGNVEIVGAQVEAGAKNKAITITTTGSITELDGICFTAVVSAGSTKEALNPGQGLVLKNIRAKVSGYYESEL